MIWLLEIIRIITAAKMGILFVTLVTLILAITFISEKRGKSTSYIFISENSPSTQREFLVIMILQVATIFQGLPAMLVYAEPLFAQALPADVISPNLCSVLMGVVTTVSGTISAFLTDLVGRRVSVYFLRLMNFWYLKFNLF